MIFPGKNGLMHLITPVDNFVLFWMNSFVIVGESGLFCCFYSIFDGKSCKQTM